jgi:hypothetical protein
VPRGLSNIEPAALINGSRWFSDRRIGIHTRVRWR